MISSKLFSIEGRVIVIGGASRGIGFAIAEGLQQLGGTVIGLSRTLCSQQHNFQSKLCDISDTVSFDTLIKEINQDYGRIDGYIHVAGITQQGSGILQEYELFATTIQANLNVPYMCCCSVAKIMSKEQKGTIVIVTSIGSIQSFPNNPGYVASKGGLRMLSKALALDLGQHGIRVNTIAPGYIETDMTKQSYDDLSKRELRSSRTMLGRWGKPDELIGAAVFLLSDASSYITGSDIIVDGGWTAKGL